MEPVLQVALDHMHLKRALLAAKEAVEGGADWLEAGTPLVKLRGTALRVSAETAKRLEARAKLERRTVPEVAREILEVLTPKGDPRRDGRIHKG